MKKYIQHAHFFYFYLLILLSVCFGTSSFFTDLVSDLVSDFFYCFETTAGSYLVGAFFSGLASTISSDFFFSFLDLDSKFCGVGAISDLD